MYSILALLIQGLKILANFLSNFFIEVYGKSFESPWETECRNEIACDIIILDTLHII
jgi:hypothetical protein